VRWARRLAWVSLFVVLVEGGVGLWEGLSVGSVALTGWALGGGAEALGSAMVVWRFSGARTLSHTAEARARRGVAVSFWLTAPYVAAESIHHLIGEHRADTSVLGIGLTVFALLLMPVLGRANRRLGARLHSEATEGEGTQNYLCAIQAAGVLAGLAITAVWPDGWWFDPVIGLAVAAAAVWQGVRSWRGHSCGC
jgi:divalent metal cation (Fe/Co/Zn/Cd) transporter